MHTNERDLFPWGGFAASVPGSGHIRHDLPCQDASRVLTSPRPAVIVCDGRGSAPLSHFGAQAAVRSFEFQLGVLEPLIANTLDEEEEMPERWDRLCRLLYRALAQAKLELMQERNERAEKEVKEKDFDFTASFAVVGKRRIGCFQVGDGAIVLRQDGGLLTVFPPDKGEFANQTHFVRAGKDGSPSLHTAMFPAESVSGIAVTSDGPEHLMFRLTDMMPGPVFGQLFDDLAQGELRRQDLLDYLTRPAWNDDPRGTDDRTIALLGRDLSEAEHMPQPMTDIPEAPIEETAAPSEPVVPSKPVVPSDPVVPEKSVTPRIAEVPAQAESGKSVIAVSRHRLPMYAVFGAICLGLIAMQWHLKAKVSALEAELQEIRQMSVTSKPPVSPKSPAAPKPVVAPKPAVAPKPQDGQSAPAQPADLPAGDKKSDEKTPEPPERTPQSVL